MHEIDVTAFSEAQIFRKKGLLKYCSVANRWKYNEMVSMSEMIHLFLLCSHSCEASDH